MKFAGNFRVKFDALEIFQIEILRNKRIAKS